ncbi:MAG: hypothetical protein DMG11_32310 [Acidobacteria bacterium]|nr:MAG: hypothetical protein DMG11_32310 [Acidobacteriota bacterium]
MLVISVVIPIIPALIIPISLRTSAHEIAVDVDVVEHRQSAAELGRCGIVLSFIKNDGNAPDPAARRDISLSLCLRPVITG